MPQVFNLETFAGGRLTAQLNHAIQEVLDNMADPNTDPLKVREVNCSIKFKSNYQRDAAIVTIDVKPKLAPPVSTTINIMMERDMDTGLMVAAELGKAVIPGQVEMKVEEIVTPTNNVVDLRRKNEEVAK